MGDTDTGTLANVALTPPLMPTPSLRPMPLLRPKLRLMPRLILRLGATMAADTVTEDTTARGLLTLIPQLMLTTVTTAEDTMAVTVDTVVTTTTDVDTTGDKRTDHSCT